MKTLIIVLAITLSANSYAIISSSTATSLSSVSTVNINDKYAVTLKDANEYYQSGQMSLSLAEEVKNVQDTLKLSELESVDLLVLLAETNTYKK